MQYVWNMYGICMEYAWNMDGISMEYAWNMYGICMEYAWKMYGICMEYAWHMYGICMEDAWKMYGICMEYAWNMYGRCMECVWNLPIPKTHTPSQKNNSTVPTVCKEGLSYPSQRTSQKHANPLSSRIAGKTSRCGGFASAFSIYEYIQCMYI